MRPDILLCGASGSGKTATSRALCQFGYLFAKTETRKFEDECGGRELINRDPTIRDQFQQKVAEETSRLILQYAYSNSNNGKHMPFVADRCLDFLMYETIYGNKVHRTRELQAVKNLIQYIQSATEENLLKVFMITRNADEMNGAVGWKMSVSHKYYTRTEVRKQEIVMETILKMYGIPFTKVPRVVVKSWILEKYKNH